MVDNSDDHDSGNQDMAKKEYPEIVIINTGANLGFAKAYNLMINKARQEKAEYFLAINPDVILEEKAVSLMIKTMDDDKTLGSISPKILKWDFINNKKTDIIDSCGLKLLPGLRFVDLGQGETDHGQYNSIDILGPSGAAAMFRMSALEEVNDQNGYFDENMFMYKEDCDLAFRLNLAGYKSMLVPDAVVYHDRTASSSGQSDLAVAKNRKNKTRKVKEWSFLNQQLIFWKYWRRINRANKMALVWYQVKILIYAVFFEPYLFSVLPDLYRIRKKEKIY